MKTKEIITSIIKKDERLSNISINTKTNKIEINGDKITSFDYDEILEKCKLEWPDIKFTKQAIKEVVSSFARENKYEPEHIKNINKEEAIIQIIKDDERLSSIRLNTKTNKIDIGNRKISIIDYDDILDKCKEEYPDTKFTKQLIKVVVDSYADEHKYEPENKHNNSCPWYDKYKVDEKGKILSTYENICIFFENDPRFKGKLLYDEFTGYETYDNELINDRHMAKICNICEQELGFDNEKKVEKAIKIVTDKNSFNPFKQKLNEIIWDGIERAETFFIKFIGVHDTTLNRSLTKKWFYAMMKRLYEPGCDFDNMLIIYDSKQGTGKSKIVQRLIESLGVNYGYDTSISCDNRDKDNVDKLNKTWIVGIDEMQEFLKRNPEQTKQFLAQSFDTARLSYAIRSKQYLRHCVFYGNSNIEYFLKDYTSNFERRYWIMEADGEVHDKEWWDNNLTVEYCQQVLAEMKYFYETNPSFYYTGLSLKEQEELKEVQFRHKTLNNDDLLQHKIFKVLDNYYSKTIFNDYDDFHSFKITSDNDNNTVNITPVEKEFLGEKTIDDSAGGKISKIPVKWIKMLVEEDFKRTVSTQYITALISTKWEYKKAKYNNVTTNCYVRIDK